MNYRNYSHYCVDQPNYKVKSFFLIKNFLHGQTFSLKLINNSDFLSKFSCFLYSIPFTKSGTFLEMIKLVFHKKSSLLGLNLFVRGVIEVFDASGFTTAKF